MKENSQTAIKLKAIWDQQNIPVILRRDGQREKHRIRLPNGRDEISWLKSENRIWPEWNLQFHCWEIPKAWFNKIVERSLERYGNIYVIQPFREQQKCSPACMDAKGHICECSCMGENHGAGNDGTWFEVSDTFATRWGERELACRFMSVSSN